MTKKLFALILLIILTGVILAGCGPKEVTLEVYAGDATKKAMSTIKESYEELHPNVTINYNFAASKTLEATMRTLQQGDLYAAEAKDIGRMDQDGLIVESYPFAALTPAIIVRTGDNTIASWDDLAKDGVRITVLNPELGSAGRAADKVISNSPLSEQIRANITVFVSTPSEAAQMLQNDKVDAVIIWDSVAKTNPNLAVVEIPEEINVTLEIWVAVPTYTTAESDALAFAEYVIGPAGQQAFENTGFSILEK